MPSRGRKAALRELCEEEPPVVPQSSILSEEAAGTGSLGEPGDFWSTSAGRS